MKRGPQYMDYDRFPISASASKRKPAPLLKQGQGAPTAQDGLLQMGIGFPSQLTFPLVEADFKLRDGSTVHVDETQMATFLQYTLGGGYPDLKPWLTEFQRRVHSPPTLLDPEHPGHFDLVISNGTKEALTLTFQLLLDEGDYVLIEEATYPGAVAMISSVASTHSIKTDGEGMVTEDLVRVLTSWDDLHPGCKKPRVLYVVTSCSNPTGVTWSLARRRAVYNVARSHDLLILEDDAYYFLQFSRPPIPSFLSMDVDGRVIHFETFSKIIAPGMRIATVSGPAPLMTKLKMYNDFGLLSPSGLPQVMLVQLFRHWGHDGLLRHLDSVMEFYRHKVQVAVQAAQQHLSDLAEWTTPSGGMFLWLRVLGVDDSSAIVQKARQRRLVVVRGSLFMPASEKSSYIRISVAMVTEEECDQAFKILAEVIKEETGKCQL